MRTGEFKVVFADVVPEAVNPFLRQAVASLLSEGVSSRVIERRSDPRVFNLVGGVKRLFEVERSREALC
jgi:hypothetical protein